MEKNIKQHYFFSGDNYLPSYFITRGCYVNTMKKSTDKTKREKNL